MRNNFTPSLDNTYALNQWFPEWGGVADCLATAGGAVEFMKFAIQ